MKCKCAEELAQNAKFCRKCGEPVQQIVNNESLKQDSDIDQVVVSESQQECQQELQLQPQRTPQ